MSRVNRLAFLGLAALVVAASAARAQNQYIGYVYPAGGQQGTSFPIRLGGQALLGTTGLVVSGEGVTVRLVEHYRTLDNQEMSFLNQQLAALRKGDAVIDDALAARMAWYEFPAPIGPPDEPKPGDKPAKVEFPASDKERARLNLIARIQKRIAEDERNPAVRSQTELIFAEVTVAPDAAPGRREIRVVSRRGVSNPLPFYVGQVPEFARKAMKTCQLPVLGKEHLAQRKRPPEEEELRVTLPCTMNGQIAPGEVNRYRFGAKAGKHLVISARARDLVPYVADGVPGWFQAVLRLRDAAGKELAYCDDFRFHPDPLIYFPVPADGEYFLTINEALFRGRESFVYRITVGELPHVTGIFPLGGRAGEPVTIEADGWNLDGAKLAPPPKDARPGVHLLTATDGKLVSNAVPFAVDTLPECREAEPNNDAAHAQQMSLPVIVNGRVDRPGDWDLFAVQGKAGETVAVEVTARRLGSPLDSFVKVTTADGEVIAVNDDHFDAASGLNTDHADSYLLVKLPTDGRYFVHLTDTARRGGREYAYRLRISPPRPDFGLRVVPSRVNIPARGSAAVTVHALRKDGFDGPIKLSFKDLPEGMLSPGATLAAKQDSVTLPLRTTLGATGKPVNLTVLGTATAGGRDITREAVPAEDKMQAFLWRHLLPADTLPALVFDAAVQPPANRIPPPIRDEDRPKDVKPNLTRASVDSYLRQLDNLYQDWFLTEEFIRREVGSVEARLIK